MKILKVIFIFLVSFSSLSARADNTFILEIALSSFYGAVPPKIPFKLYVYDSDGDRSEHLCEGGCTFDHAGNAELILENGTTHVSFEIEYDIFGPAFPNKTNRVLVRSLDTSMENGVTKYLLPCLLYAQTGSVTKDRSSEDMITTLALTAPADQLSPRQVYPAYAFAAAQPTSVKVLMAKNIIAEIGPEYDSSKWNNSYIEELAEEDIEAVNKIELFADSLMNVKASEENTGDEEISAFVKILQELESERRKLGLSAATVSDVYFGSAMRAGMNLPAGDVYISGTPTYYMAEFTKSAVSAYVGSSNSYLKDWEGIQYLGTAAVAKEATIFPVPSLGMALQTAGTFADEGGIREWHSDNAEVVFTELKTNSQ